MKYIECPDEWNGLSTTAVFLAGGITSCPQWQTEVVDKLKDSSLTLINPRRKQWDITNPLLEVAQIEWEHAHFLRACAILFWFPCETLCPITLYELGAWNPRPKKLFIGCHPDYKRKKDVEIQTHLERPAQVIASFLDELVQQVQEWEIKKIANNFYRDEDQPTC